MMRVLRKHPTRRRGDYICVFVSCGACLEHVKTGAGFNADYIRPRRKTGTTTVKPPDREADDDDPWAQ